MTLDKCSCNPRAHPADDVRGEMSPTSAFNASTPTAPVGSSMSFGGPVTSPVRAAPQGIGQVAVVGVPSVREALVRAGERRSATDVVVPPSHEVDFVPDDRQWAEHFVRVSISSYADLQALRLVPPKLDQRPVLSALREDDMRTLEVARACAARQREPFASVYDKVRRRNNPALAELLSAHYAARVEWDSLLPERVRQSVRRLLLSRPHIIWVVGLTAPPNIIIKHGAILSLSKWVFVLFANNIQIYKGGTLRVNGGYLKINAHSIEGEIP